MYNTLELVATAAMAVVAFAVPCTIVVLRPYKDEKEK